MGLVYIICMGSILYCIYGISIYYSYCVYGIILYYNNARPKKHLKNEQRSRDAAAKKRANTSGVGKITNYCEDIYIPPYNNTH